MTILGIDPGYAIVGWAIIENNLKLVDYGVILTSPSQKLPARLHAIHNQLNEIISRYKPDSVAIEKLYFSKNTTTALDVAKAIGTIELTLSIAGLDFQEYSPAQVKQAVTGFGKAKKEQVQTMIKKIFCLDEIPKPDDAADALAIAACHSLNWNPRIS